MVKVDDDSFVKAGEAAKYIGVCVQTLRNWQSRGVLVPDKVYPSGHRWYSKKKLEKFVKEQKCT